MIIENEIFKDKTGEEILLRNAKEEDSQDLIDYLKITNAQSPYLIWSSLKEKMNQKMNCSCSLFVVESI